MRQIDGFNIKLKYQESAKRLENWASGIFPASLVVVYLGQENVPFRSGIETHKTNNFIKIKKARESKHVELETHLNLLSPGKGGGESLFSLS